MLVVLKYKMLVDQFLKPNTILANKILKKNIQGVNQNIPNTNGGLVKKTNLNTKITEIEIKYLVLIVQ